MVTDSNGCVATDTVSITTVSGENISPVVSAIADSTLCNGIAIVEGPGFTQAYRIYLWDNGETDYFADSLCYGLHTVLTSLQNGCLQKDSAYIGLLSTNCDMSDSVVLDDCPGSCSNKIFMHLASGAGPANFVWREFVWNPDSSLSGLCAGDYHCMMIDAAGCVDSMNIHIPDQSAQPQFEIVYYDAADPCATEVEVSFPGLTPDEFTWCNDSSGFVTQLCPGECFIHYTCNYFEGFTIPFTVTVPQCGAFVSKNKISCHGLCDGSLRATAAGTMPFQFHWNTGDTSQTIGNLCPGTYTVFYNDASGCFDTVTAELTDPDTLSLAFSTQYDTCVQQCNTTALITGGTPPYSMTWCDSVHSFTIHGCEYSCNVIVMDAHSCIASDSLNLVPLETLSVEGIVRNSSCDNCADGSIRFIGHGGVPPYAYTDFPPVEHIQGDSLYQLIPGTYHICVMDQTGCRSCNFSTVGHDAGNGAVNNQNIIISNNVTNNSIVVEINNAPQGELWFVMSDRLGRLLRREIVNHDRVEIHAAEFAAGVYCFRIEGDEFIWGNGKIVLMK